MGVGVCYHLHTTALLAVGSGGVGTVLGFKEIPLPNLRGGSLVPGFAVASSLSLDGVEVAVSSIGAANRAPARFNLRSNSAGFNRGIPRHSRLANSSSNQVLIASVTSRAFVFGLLAMDTSLSCNLLAVNCIEFVNIYYRGQSSLPVWISSSIM